MARLRSVPLISLCALCVGAGSPVPAAIAAPSGQAGRARPAHKSAAHHRRARRSAGCATHSSYHSSHRPAHPPRRRTSCRGRRPRTRHATSRLHARKLHARKLHARKLHARKLHSRHFRAGRRPQQPKAGARPPAPARPAPGAGDGRCPNTTLAPNEYDLTRIREAVLCLVNRERRNHGEGPLVANPRLEAAAQGHTESMAFGNYVEHVGPRGETPLSRMQAAGYIYSSRVGYEVGENIGWGTLWEGTPRAIVAAWMASAGHRANILDPRFRDTGVGVSPHPPSSFAGHQAGGIYTQDFGVIIAG